MLRSAVILKLLSTAGSLVLSSRVNDSRPSTIASLTIVTEVQTRDRPLWITRVGTLGSWKSCESETAVERVASTLLCDVPIKSTQITVVPADSETAYTASLNPIVAPETLNSNQ